MSTCALIALVCGCMPLSFEGATSYGAANAGHLVRGVAVADRGEGYVRARPGESTAYALPGFRDAVTRAAADVARRHPGTASVRIGDFSAPDGGVHPRHGSHRSGRDVDIIFYLADAEGTSVHGRGWLAFDRSGVARETTAPEGVTPSRELFYFDTKRNWAFVRALVLDPEARVQWIFCSKGVRARLLAYAARYERDPEAILRASHVLRQPTRGNPHADHFHVRALCGAHQRALGCQDYGPRWPWLRDEDEKFDEAVPRADDAQLVRWLFDDEGADTLSEAL